MSRSNNRHTSFVFLVVLSYVLTTVRTQVDDDRPYLNLYGRDSLESEIPKILVDTLAGGIEFMVKGGEFMNAEPPDVSPRFNEGARYDFIVVGAGTAGATVAGRLAEIPGIKVLLVEAGRSESLLMDIPLLVNYLQFSEDINWKYKTEPSNSYCRGMKNGQCNWPRGKVMGGSSVLNYMIATRGNKKDYDRWAELGNFGWSWKDVLPYFKKLETMGVPEFRNDSKHHNLHGPVHTDYAPFHTVLAEAFVKAGVELGYDEVDYNGEKNTGFSYLQSTTKNGYRLSSSKAYLHKAKLRRNLVVTKHSLVSKILFNRNGKRAIGIEYYKGNIKRQVLAKKEVILCAGAIGSPQLLMLSGIGPAKHLQDLNINVIVDAPVGENLMDHIAYGGLIFTVQEPIGISIVDMFNPTLPYIRDFLIDRNGPLTIPGGTEALGFINVDDDNDPEDYPNVELLFASASAATIPIIGEGIGLNDEFWKKSYGDIKEKYSWTIFPMLLRPKSRGKILLRDSDVNSKPRLIPNYMNHPEDVRILVAGIRAAIKISRTKSMQKVTTRFVETLVPGCESLKYDSDDYWECAVRTVTMNIYHYSGTCKMGPENDPTAVVNPRLKVIGVQGLRVADASIMPEIMSGHTNIPTYMIAEKLADMVKQDWGYRTDPLP